MNVKLIIQLLLMAYALATSTTASGPVPAYLSIPSMALLSFCTLGMRALGIQLSDPFGDDEIDFNVEEIMHVAYKNMLSVLSTELHAPHASRLPAGMSNPLLPNQAAADNAAAADASPSGRRSGASKPAVWGVRPRRVVRKWGDLLLHEADEPHGAREVTQNI